MPKNYREEEVLAIINTIAIRLSKDFTFGYYDREDIKQQISLFALEGLEKYDGKRPLENFLWVLVKHKLINFKRDEYERVESPCIKCKIRLKDKCGILQKDCTIYNKWINRNRTKRGLMSPVRIGCVDEEEEATMKTYDLVDDIVHLKTIKDIINDKIPIDIRKDYLRMLSGIRIGTNREKRVRRIVGDILKDINYDTETREV
jgi:hypothetical protein